MTKLSRADKFRNEGLASYLDVRKCLKDFENLIQKDCSDFLKSKSAELRKILKPPKASDVPIPYAKSYEEGAEIGAGVWDNDHYVCVGVVWENEKPVRAYASRYVGDGKKMADYVYNKIRRPGMEKEEANGWYLTIYEVIQIYDRNHILKAISSALNKWLKIGSKFQVARSPAARNRPA